MGLFDQYTSYRLIHDRLIAIRSDGRHLIQTFHSILLHPLYALLDTLLRIFSEFSNRVSAIPDPSVSCCTLSAVIPSPVREHGPTQC